MFPLAILLPTRNAMRLLPAHVESMRPWLDLAQEVLVVDSDSHDGTLDFLTSRLPQARIFRHPRGLYESWNFGLRQINAPFTYISTIGDGITREGLLHLHQTAQRHAADVVISPPEFVDRHGRTIQKNPWPVHDIRASLRLDEEICLEGLLLFLTAMSYLPFALLGSSASNLYRTATLQAHPFPTEYGRNGDGAWGLLHALHIRLALTPRSVSFFRLHRRAPEETPSPNGDQRMFDAACANLVHYLNSDPRHRAQARELDMDALLQAKRTVLRWRGRLQAARDRWGFSWGLDPRAWQARRNREAAQRHCRELLRNVLRAEHPLQAGGRDAALASGAARATA